jgi:hypothetical protein
VSLDGAAVGLGDRDFVAAAGAVGRGRAGGSTAGRRDGRYLGLGRGGNPTPIKGSGRDGDGSRRPVSRQLAMWSRVGTATNNAREWNAPARDPILVSGSAAGTVSATVLEWDGQVADLHVDVAARDHVTVVVIVSTVNAPRMTPVRWRVREAFVTYLQ